MSTRTAQPDAESARYKRAANLCFFGAFVLFVTMIAAKVHFADARTCIETAEQKSADIVGFAPPGTVFVIPGRMETVCVRRAGALAGRTP